MNAARHPSTDWRRDALCARPFVNADLWYPDASADAAIPRSVCLDCPVTRPCLEAGLHEEYGVWGGYTSSERKRLRRYLPTDPVTRHLALDRAARLGPALAGLADHDHPLKNRSTDASSADHDPR